jgi:hypothetical protein
METAFTLEMTRGVARQHNEDLFSVPKDKFIHQAVYVNTGSVASMHRLKLTLIIKPDSVQRT